jgi:hypothetical protein
VEELTVRLDTSPPEHTKRNAMVTTTIMGPREVVNKLGASGQGLIGGLPIHEFVKFKSGDLFRVTIQKLRKRGDFPPSAATAIKEIHKILFFVDGEPTPDKSWSADTLDQVAAVLESVLPRPKPRK